MAKARSLESKLAGLRELRRAASAPEAVAGLRSALADASNFVVAEAAGIAGEAGLVELAPDLAEAFGRFLVDPLQSDKTCAAKVALVEALNKLGASTAEVFLRGARFVQLEPVWGGRKDVAGPLRGASAFGLVRLDHDEALPILADLLADPERPARAAAAQALGYCDARAAVPLLRLKARLGDADADVLSDCFASLLRLAPEPAVPFVAQFLAAAGGVGGAAALALGESRRPEAFEVLTGFWKAPVARKMQEEVLLAVALLRLPAAVDFLLARIAEQPEAAAAAVAALAVRRHDSQVTERTEAAVAASGDPRLRRLFEERFRPR
jgi:HEAT repeat protein